MSELLPCPFCGGEAEAVHEIDGFWTVECIKCGALVDGIESWNTRAERTCTMEPSFTEPSRLDFMQEYRCSKCDEYGYMQIAVDGDRLNYCPNCGAKVKEGCKQ